MNTNALILVARICESLEALNHLLERLPIKAARAIQERRFEDIAAARKHAERLVTALADLSTVGSQERSSDVDS
jgi:hypothetical protein